jgi:hypothetical protein
MRDRKSTPPKKTCTFPDGSAFPVASVFDVGENAIQVCYFDEGLPQIVWVPSDFVSSDSLAPEEARLPR